MKTTISEKISITSKFFGAILLISGTAIGGGMFALPITTAKVGFVPSTVLFTITWLCMTFTAFLILEANLSIKGHANLISITRQTLGKTGEGVAWVSYLLLLYALMAAYITGISSLVQQVFESLFRMAFSSVPTVFIATLLVAFFDSLRRAHDRSAKPRVDDWRRALLYRTHILYFTTCPHRTFD